MGEKICFITMGLIFTISLTLIILNIIWLFPIKNNSKKEEPLGEIISSLIPNYNTLYLDSLDSSEEICEKNLYNSFKVNTYETFNFKMKEIHTGEIKTDSQ